MSEKPPFYWIKENPKKSRPLEDSKFEHTNRVKLARRNNKGLYDVFQIEITGDQFMQMMQKSIPDFNFDLSLEKKDELGIVVELMGINYNMKDISTIDKEFNQG